MIVHCEQPPLIDKNGWRTCYYYIIGGFSHNAKATTTTRTAGGLFVSQSFVFGNNQKLHNEKQGHALTKKPIATFANYRFLLVFIVFYRFL